jgi:DNA-binding response OmpR family regulator
MTAERNEILKAGFDDYQAKPISIKEFIPAIKNVLNTRLNSQDTS